MLALLQTCQWFVTCWKLSLWSLLFSPSRKLPQQRWLELCFWPTRKWSRPPQGNFLTRITSSRAWYEWNHTPHHPWKMLKLSYKLTYMYMYLSICNIETLDCWKWCSSIRFKHFQFVNATYTMYKLYLSI